MERDWRSSKPEEEEEEEDTSDKGSWRRDAGDESFVEEEGVGSSRDFRTQRHETWTPTREKEDLTAAAEVREGVAAAIAEIGHREPAAPFAGEAWAAAIQSESESKTAVAEIEKPTVPAAEPETLVEHAAEPAVAEQPVVSDPVPEPEPEPVGESTVDSLPAVVAEDSAAVEAPTPSATTSWFSTPPSPWEVEAQKANQLASTWDAVVAAPSSETDTRGDVSFEPTSAPDEIEVVSASSISSAIPAAAVETVREEAAQAVEQAEQEAERAGTSADAGETVHDATPQLDMDAVVAKVLARLSPGLLNDATRELLRPVVEAVIREELNSKKQ